MNPVPVVLSIQDMSSIGRCSLTVAMPLLSAFGSQAVPFPTALLCNHLEYPTMKWSTSPNIFVRSWIAGKKRHHL